MQFVRTAIWVALAVLLVLFCVANNDQSVDVAIWPGIVWETKLWFAILVAFLLGAVPMWAAWRAGRWRLKRRLDSTERALATALLPADPPPGQAVEPQPSDRA